MVGLFKVSILFETLYYNQFQRRVCTTSEDSYKHMNMHIFIIIIILQTNKTVDFVIHLTHGEDHNVIYYALLSHVCYIVVFCHGSTPGARD